MTRNRQRLADYLGHVVEAIERIERYTEDIDEAAFLRSELMQDAVIRNLEVVGEACRNIDRDHADFSAAHPEFPLAIAYEMRNALAHGYFKVDLEIVWKTVQHDLPNLRDLAAKLREQVATDSR